MQNKKFHLYAAVFYGKKENRIDHGTISWNKSDAIRKFISEMPAEHSYRTYRKWGWRIVKIKITIP